MSFYSKWILPLGISSIITCQAHILTSQNRHTIDITQLVPLGGFSSIHSIQKKTYDYICTSVCFSNHMLRRRHRIIIVSPRAWTRAAGFIFRRSNHHAYTPQPAKCCSRFVVVVESGTERTPAIRGWYNSVTVTPLPWTNSGYTSADTSSTRVHVKIQVSDVSHRVIRTAPSCVLYTSCAVHRRHHHHHHHHHYCLVV